MRSNARKLLVLAASAFSAAAIAADFDGSESLLCSFGEAFECDDGAECRKVSLESIDAPDFVKLDFRRKQIVSVLAGEDGAPDAIDNVVDLANYLVVQGVQGGDYNDTLGWSFTISHESGDLVASGAGENAAFVIFGACTPD